MAGYLVFTGVFFVMVNLIFKPFLVGIFIRVNDSVEKEELKKQKEYRDKKEKEKEANNKKTN